MAVAIAAGCAGSDRKPDLGRIYAESAHHQGELGNPVILVPGLMGSNLIDKESGRSVWGAFRAGSINPNSAEGARLVALPMDESLPLGGLRDSVEPDGVLDKVRFNVLRLPLSLKAYTGILSTLSLAGFRDESLARASAGVYGNDHFTCFQFPYDFRRSNAENAAKLDDFIRDKEAYLMEEYRKRGIHRDKPVKFDIIAHSMGGLVVRYYLRYGRAPLPADGTLPPMNWAGAERVARVILVGTPNAGSVQTLEKLTGGLHFPLIATYSPAVLGTFPSVYELLPRPRHNTLMEDGKPVDFMDPAEWERRGWGLADPGQEKDLAQLMPDVPDPADRRRIALDQLQKALRNAAQFHAALDAPGVPPPGTRISLAAGDAIATPAVAGIGRRGLPEVRDNAPGDGVVTRGSALMDERMGGPVTSRLDSPVAWDQVLFISSGHREITGRPEFINNMLFQLLEMADQPHPGT